MIKEFDALKNELYAGNSVTVYVDGTWEIICPPKEKKKVLLHYMNDSKPCCYLLKEGRTERIDNLGIYEFLQLAEEKVKLEVGQSIVNSFAEFHKVVNTVLKEVFENEEILKMKKRMDIEESNKKEYRSFLNKL